MNARTTHGGNVNEARRTRTLRPAVAAAVATVWLAASAALALGAGTTVSLKSGDETIQAYLAVPAAPAATAKGARAPALVLVHEWYGLSDWVKSVADRYAAQGYVAIAPDLYRGKLAGPNDAELAHELMRGLPDARAVRDLRAAAAYLRTRHDLKLGKTAVVGFCMGGRLSLLSSLDHGPFDATVVCYGSPETDVARLRTLRGPVLGIYAEKDRGIGPDQTGPFEMALRKTGHLAAVHVYPGVGHAFLRDAGSPEGEEQAKLAWAEIDAFLAASLKRK